jgi:stage II sporulation protein D
LALLLPLAAPAVEIGVLGLFHPIRLGLESADGPLRLQIDGVSVGAKGAIELSLKDGAVVVKTARTERSGQSIQASGAFVLSVPGKLARRYRGELLVRPDGAELLAVVRMDLEAAVASVLVHEAEDEPQAAAREAQAIVSRSYLAAGSRHKKFDFCDTTHCQWLGEALPSESVFSQAAGATRGLVLLAGGDVIQALFSPRCGGRTRTLAELGFSADGYPFYAVECEFCQRNPDHWERRFRAAEIPEILEQHGQESARLAVVRRLGWSALPSNAYRLTRQGEQVEITGEGRGHGAGLCQSGASELAARGLSATEILRVYFPNTSVGAP